MHYWDLWRDPRTGTEHTDGSRQALWGWGMGDGLQFVGQPLLRLPRLPLYAVIPGTGIGLDQTGGREKKKQTHEVHF